MLQFDKLDAVLDRDEKGLPVAYDLQFQPDATVAHTYCLQNGEDANVHLYIDVDSENVPIAISLVHPAARVEYKRIPKSDPVFQHEVSKVYEFACITAKWAETMKHGPFVDVTQLRKGVDIVGDTTRRMRDLEQYALATA